VTATLPLAMELSPAPRRNGRWADMGLRGQHRYHASVMPRLPHARRNPCKSVRRFLAQLLPEWGRYPSFVARPATARRYASIFSREMATSSGTISWLTNTAVALLRL